MITEKKKVDTVSVIVPVYNEEKYIESCIDSILNQDYDFNKMELIFVDGNSNDKTKEIISNKLAKKIISYKILENPRRLTPVSMNIGIKSASNEIIIRLDAHSEYPKNYISKCVYYLNNTEADNVGCLFDTQGKGTIGKCIENVLKSKFGVGNSGFRINSKSGYVETVPYGTFRKELFYRIGYFNEELIRSEDNDFNYRIIKNGGKIYLFNDISIIYHPRNTLKSLSKMAYQNGKWVLYTNYLTPGSMKIRHFIPMAFVLGLLGGIFCVLFEWKLLTNIFLLCIYIYLFINICFTIKHIYKNGLAQLLCFVIYPLFHISYGIGTIFGIKKIFKKGKVK